MPSNSDHRVSCTPCECKALSIPLWATTSNVFEVSRKVMYNGSLLSLALARISVIISAANKGEYPCENPNCRWIYTGSRMWFACEIICFSTIWLIMEVIVMHWYMFGFLCGLVIFNTRVMLPNLYSSGSLPVSRAMLVRWHRCGVWDRGPL